MKTLPLGSVIVFATPVGFSGVTVPAVLEDGAQPVAQRLGAVVDAEGRVGQPGQREGRLHAVAVLDVLVLVHEDHGVGAQRTGGRDDVGVDLRLDRAAGRRVEQVARR